MGVRVPGEGTLLSQDLEQACAAGTLGKSWPEQQRWELLDPLVCDHATDEVQRRAKIQDQGLAT